MDRSVVTVFGGSGFVGRHLVQRLAKKGYVVRVAVRDTESAMFLKPMGNVGQIVPVQVDITDDSAVRGAVAGAHAVVNLVGILFQRKKGQFDAIHHQAAGRIARLAKEAGVARYVHMSALGADADSKAEYARTKARGEKAVLEAFPEAMITRPSVVFGAEDQFFNRFAAMATLSPVLPVVVPEVPRAKRGGGWLPSLDLFSGGGPKFQPVYVGDVADAIMRGVDRDVPQRETAGQVFELGGPEVMTMKRVMEFVLETTWRKALLMPLPVPVAKVNAFFLEFLPEPPLTRDQVNLMLTDNVVGGTLPGFKELGIEAQAAEGIVPGYLDRFRRPSKVRQLPA